MNETAVEKKNFSYYWKKFLALDASTVILALIAAIILSEIILQLRTPGSGGLIFMTPGNLMMILRQNVYIGIIAFGLTLVMLTGNIDLSVGNMLTFLCSFCAVIMMRTDNVF